MRFMPGEDLRRAFTFIELLTVVGIITLLFLIGIPSLHFFQQNTQLDDAAQNIKNIIDLARNKTLASEQAQQYGVFFDNASYNRYVLFRGNSFTSRDMSADQAYFLPQKIKFSQINFGGLDEVVFQRISGEPQSSGFVAITRITEPVDIRTISVDNSGAAFVGTLSTPSGADRLKDSRHVHIGYSRFINSATESFIFTWTGAGGPVSQKVKIADYMQSGNFIWQGSISVNGENQIVAVRTHRLNDPDTEISISRPKDQNTKPFQISLDGDSSGNIISYLADGSTVNGISIYASEPSLQ